METLLVLPAASVDARGTREGWMVGRGVYR